MADITWSSSLPLPSVFEFGLRSNTLAHVSPLTGSVQTVALPGARWTVRMEWSRIAQEQSVLLEALFARLRGRQNRLVLWHLARPTLRGVGGGTPVVNGAGQTGSTLNVSGLPASTANVWRAGDMIGVGGELKMVVQDVTSNASGQASVLIEPPLRASPANGSAIVTVQPTARFIQDEDANAWRDVPGLAVEGHAISLVESF